MNRITYPGNKVLKYSFDDVGNRVKQIILMACLYLSIDKYRDWLKEDFTKRKKNRRTAKRIFEILNNDFQYEGSYESIARFVKILKKELKHPNPEGFIPLTFEPGEAFQFDWGEVEAIIDNKLKKLNLAVIVLCHSRYFYAWHLTARWIIDVPMGTCSQSGCSINRQLG